jgi:hypothetical protein
MVEITLPIVLQILQTAGILVGIFYYIMTLNYTRKNQEQTLETRKAMVFHNVIGQLLTNSDALKNGLIIEDNPISSIEEFHELWENPEYKIAVTWNLMLFENLGVYIREGIVDIDMFAKFQPYWVLHFWEGYKDVIYYFRERYGPSAYRNTEYVMIALQEYLDKHPEPKT